MSEEKKIMSEFVGKLWANPALAGASVVRRENQILSFIRENQTQLQQAFAKPGYFPDLGWDGSIRLLFSVLTDLIVDSVEPRLDKILGALLNPEVLPQLEIRPQEVDRERIKDFILKGLRNKATRDPYIAVLETISYGLYDRYVPKALARHKVIHNEFYRKDRLSLPAPIMIAYLQLCSLFRPLYWQKVATASNNQLNLAAVAKDPRMFDSTYKFLNAFLVQEMGGVPDRILRVGLESCMNAEEHPDTGGSARLIGILVARAAEFDPTQKQDRGAESPDKSWFHIHKKTAKYYGYDARYLDELYQIASEEAW
ncbi:MAG TPA: hypothetical protein PKX74_00555 [Leptospiraceae bacterium]|nr:hypothetical protein [Leptospiraceae bacterium]HNJ35457.1 hypothetical protein [Leptospiraceae bacterium]